MALAASFSVAASSAAASAKPGGSSPLVPSGSAMALGPCGASAANGAEAAPVIFPSMPNEIAARDGAASADCAIGKEMKVAMLGIPPDRMNNMYCPGGVIFELGGAVQAIELLLVEVQLTTTARSSKCSPCVAEPGLINTTRSMTDTLENLMLMVPL